MSTRCEIFQKRSKQIRFWFDLLVIRSITESEKMAGPFDCQRKTCINFYSYHKAGKSVVVKCGAGKNVSRASALRTRKCQFPRRSREGKKPLCISLYLPRRLYLSLFLSEVDSLMLLFVEADIDRCISLKKAVTHLCGRLQNAWLI